MSFSLLVFDDTAATPVDKPFHAVFPMDVAQVRVSHMRWGCEKSGAHEKFNFILKKVLHPVQSGRYHRDFSHLISPVWAAVPLPVPGKMLNTPHIIRTMILNKRACLPVGNRFYCIQHSNHVKTLAHLHCKSEKQKQKLHVLPRLHHKRALLYNSRDHESHDRHRYPTTWVRWVLSTVV